MKRLEPSHPCEYIDQNHASANSATVAEQLVSTASTPLSPGARHASSPIGSDTGVFYGDIISPFFGTFDPQFTPDDAGAGQGDDRAEDVEQSRN